jgi:hypothetical protein
LKLKKELLCELENLEALEEENVLPGPLFARKGEIQYKLMKFMRKRKYTGLVDVTPRPPRGSGLLSLAAL